MPRVTLVHLSDLHLRSNPEAHPAEKFTAIPPYNVVWQLIDRIESEVAGAHIVITGDVTDRGSPEAFSVAADLFSGWNRGGRLSVVAGNHDDSWTRAAKGQRGYDAMVDAFEPTFSNAHLTCGYCPYVKYLRHVAIIGLDSTHWTRRPTATGNIGTEQLEALDELLDRPAVAKRVRVVLLHHHPYRLPRSNWLTHKAMQLKDAAALKETLSGRVDAVLFGHKHVAHQRRGFAGVPHWFGAPSSVRFDGRGICKARVIDIPASGMLKTRWLKLHLSDLSA